MSNLDEYKKQAALAAVEEIRSGMVVGIGHGSTVHFAIHEIADRIKSGKLENIIAIPCSKESHRKVEKLGIQIEDINERSFIDLTIDGADEIDPDLNLIKGGGGALLREKLVSQISKREIIIADVSKLSDQLGSNFPLPLEISIFGWAHQITFIESIGGKASLRKHDNDEKVLTDQGNYLLDCDFGPICELERLAHKLERRAGILEHGLFLGLATEVIVAGPDGFERIKKPNRK